MSISSRAPPEILIDVVDNLLGGSPPHSRQHHHHNTPTLQAAELVKADPSLKNVVQYHQDRNFITFTPNGPPRVVGSLGPWIPRESSHMTDHVKYFMHHLGEDWPLSIENESQIKQFDARKSSVTFQIRADARSPGFSRTHDCRLWVKKNMHLWLLVGSLLCRIAQPNPSLRILHLRLSAHAEFYPFVERILCSNKRLTDVIIEDDSHPDLDELLRPSIDLNSLSDGTDDDDFSQLDRFIIRAPAVRINAIESHRFFKRIKKATVICFAVHQFVTRPPTWEWIAHTLSHAPALQRCEFSASSSDESEYMFHHAQPPPVAKLPKLMHLTLDIPQVDIRLLDLLVAPVLKHTRIRCNNELNAHGDLAPGHFPALFCATVWCPGGARNRFRALGLKKLQYIHNIADADLLSTSTAPPQAINTTASLQQQALHKHLRVNTFPANSLPNNNPGHPNIMARWNTGDASVSLRERLERHRQRENKIKHKQTDSSGDSSSNDSPGDSSSNDSTGNSSSNPIVIDDDLPPGSTAADPIIVDNDTPKRGSTAADPIILD